jgi:hypothetical protein
MPDVPEDVPLSAHRRQTAPGPTFLLMPGAVMPRSGDLHVHRLRRPVRRHDPLTRSTSVSVGLPALRDIMRTELEAGRYHVLQGTLPELRSEVIDTLVASTYGISVRARFAGK